jgi:hypothetical protein
MNDEPFISENSFQHVSHRRLIIDHENLRTALKAPVRRSGFLLVHTARYRRFE